MDYIFDASQFNLNNFRESLMFWSDVFASHIAVAGLDGSGFRVLINADISIPGT